MHEKADIKQCSTQFQAVGVWLGIIYTRNWCFRLPPLQSCIWLIALVHMQPGITLTIVMYSVVSVISLSSLDSYLLQLTVFPHYLGLAYSLTAKAVDTVCHNLDIAATIFGCGIYTDVVMTPNYSTLCSFQCCKSPILLHIIVYHHDCFIFCLPLTESGNWVSPIYFFT
ncbi:hypothetical protein PanWU01x14_195040 [Parasponia andersonii]|uniref:Uncharacterized protein n=1 Tax=Parasponia andersonii TaxID=3476 RepID=A0A2P5C096_PARAD|nr:hypothetical protein PanWU01x14_195040 [Parasponia andersonii]